MSAIIKPEPDVGLFADEVAAGLNSYKHGVNHSKETNSLQRKQNEQGARKLYERLRKAVKFQITPDVVDVAVTTAERIDPVNLHWAMKQAVPPFRTMWIEWDENERLLTEYKLARKYGGQTDSRIQRRRTPDGVMEFSNRSIDGLESEIESLEGFVGTGSHQKGFLIDWVYMDKYKRPAFSVQMIHRTNYIDGRIAPNKFSGNSGGSTDDPGRANVEFIDARSAIGKIDFAMRAVAFDPEDQLGGLIDGEEALQGRAVLTHHLLGRAWWDRIMSKELGDWLKRAGGKTLDDLESAVLSGQLSPSDEAAIRSVWEMGKRLDVVSGLGSGFLYRPVSGSDLREIQDKEKQQQEIDSAVFQQAMMGDMRFMFVVLQLINYDWVDTSDLTEAKRGMQKKFLKKTPYNSYYKMSLAVPKPRGIVLAEKEFSGHDPLGRRQHDVRGHWHRYHTKNGVIRKWVSEFKRGDPKLGIITKDYVLVKNKQEKSKEV